MSHLKLNLYITSLKKKKMQGNIYSSILKLITFGSNENWNQQIIEKIEINPHFGINLKNQKFKKSKIITLKINSFLRNFFSSFYKEDEYLIEIVDRIGYDLNLRNLSDEYVRFVLLKKFNQICSFVCLETDIIKKKVNIVLHFKHESTLNRNNYLNDFKNKRGTEMMKISIVNIQDNKILLNFLHLLVFSKKFTPLTVGQLKRLKFFKKFINALIHFDYDFYRTSRELFLKKTKCYLLKKTSFFIQIFFQKNKKNLFLIIVIYVFYFITNFFKKPIIELITNIRSFKHIIIKSKKRPKNEIDCLKKKTKFISEIIYIFFCKKIYFYKKINKYLVGKFSIFVAQIFLLILKINIDTKVKFGTNLSYKKLLKFNEKNRSEKATKILFIIIRNITSFKIRLVLEKIFRSKKKIKSFIKFIGSIGLSKFFLKFCPKLFLINPEFKTKLIAKYDKKKNKYEISVKSEKNLIGSYLPIYLQKSNKININFYVFLRSQWQTIEIFLGNRRNIMSLFRPFIFPYPLLEWLDNDIIFFQAKQDWIYLLEIQKNKISDIFLPSILLLTYFQKQNLNYSKGIINNISDNFFFLFLLIAKFISKKNIINIKNSCEEIKFLELVTHWKLIFVLIFVEFSFIKVNKIF
nr:CPARA_3gp384 [Cryptomonas curvata]